MHAPSHPSQSYRWLFVATLLFSLTSLVLGGCTTNSIGDPCVPENVPEGGFDSAETYIETSSVQCRTRICVVNKYEGDPDNPDPDATTEVEEHVYCSCRCGAPEGSSTPTCACPTGFECQEFFQQGGAGLRGDYCVRPLPDESP